MSIARLLRAVVPAVVLAACATDPELGTSTSELVDPHAFTLPALSAADRALIVHRYSALDPTNLVPRGLLEDAIVYFDVNKALIPQSRYFVVVDLSRYSGVDRFWLVDLTTGAVEKHKVAHGAGSDPDNDGHATLFGNVSGSNKSSLGFYLTGEIYDGTHPHSMRLDGLSVDGSPNGMANTNARARLIVMHQATYVSDGNASQQGRSDGCLALDPAIEAGVVDRIHDGSLIYVATTPLVPPVGAVSCGTIPATGAVIDNGDPCFATGGPTTGLHSVTTAGLGGSLVWTHATASSTEQDRADWSLDFAQAGRYRVEVYTAAAFAQSKHAHYVVRAGTTDQTIEIDQSAHDGYQSLGELDFAQGGQQFVHLGDNTGESTAGVQLVFDAVRLTRIDDKGDAPTNAADPSDGGGADGGALGGCSTSGGGTGLAVALALLGVRRRHR